MAKAEVGIDSATSTMLEGDVKKGKTRKFVLIYKGAQIRKLIVFKKGPYNTKIQAAKKEGYRGDAICGVVRGKGVNLEFLLPGNQEVANAMKGASVADGEPTKVQKLREFLADNGLKRKPNYEIIRNPEEISDPESDDDEAATAETAGSQQDAEPASSGQDAGVDEEAKAELAETKSEVVPQIKAAVKADPSLQGEIKSMLAEAVQSEKEEDYAGALEKLKRLGKKIIAVLSSDDGDDGGAGATAAGAAGAAVGAAGGVAAGAAAGTAAGVAASSEAERAKYEADLPGAEAKVTEIAQHAQKDRITTQIAELQGYLQAAKDRADEAKYVEANAELKKINDRYPDIRALADRVVKAEGWLRNLRGKLTDAKNAMAKHQGRDGANPGIADVEAKLTEMQTKLDNAQVGQDFVDQYFVIKSKIEALRKQAHAYGDFVGLRENAMMYAQALEEHPNKNSVTTEIAAIKQKVADAQAQWDAGNHDVARAKLGTVKADYAAAKAKADGAGKAAFDQKKAEVQAKLTELDKPENQAAIGDELTAIKASLTRIDKVANANQYAEAMDGLAKTDAACDAAKEKLDRLAANGAAIDDAKGAVGGIEDDPSEAVDKVQALHDQLQRHPQIAVISKDLGKVQTQIDQAKSLLA